MREGKQLRGKAYNERKAAARQAATLAPTMIVTRQSGSTRISFSSGRNRRTMEPVLYPPPPPRLDEFI